MGLGLGDPLAEPDGVADPEAAGDAVALGTAVELAVGVAGEDADGDADPLGFFFVADSDGCGR